MYKRIEVRLNCMIGWLESETIEYSKEEFIENVKRMLESCDEALWSDIITCEQYEKLKYLIVSKSMKYFK